MREFMESLIPDWSPLVRSLADMLYFEIRAEISRLRMNNVPLGNREKRVLPEIKTLNFLVPRDRMIFLSASRSAAGGITCRDPERLARHVGVREDIHAQG